MSEDGKIYIFIAHWVTFGVACGLFTNYAKSFEPLWFGIYFIANGCIGLYIGALPFLPGPINVKIKFNKQICITSIITGTIICGYFLLSYLAR